jgi:hypothetical protein
MRKSLELIRGIGVDSLLATYDVTGNGMRDRDAVRWSSLPGRENL